MKRLLKKLLSKNNIKVNEYYYVVVVLLSWLLGSASLYCQNHANFITNGSFEIITDCNTPFVDFKAKGWSGIDSIKPVGGLYNEICGNAPYTAVGFQKAKHGNGYIRLTLFYQGTNSSFTRSNLKNRLKTNLTAGKTYCVKMFLNVQDSCATGIDAFGMYFGDDSVDTVKYNARLPLTFLNPQVSNPVGNFINDTMNWTPVSGTFVATGNEKFMIISNFKSNVATNTITTGVNLIGYAPFSEYFLDDVTCIEVDAPAYAGSDKVIMAGDSVYIGRESDYAVDPYCVWYQLPNMTTSIDTISGLWVKPTVTSTYVVKQNLDCGSEKWDTVVVYVDYVGIKENNLNKKLEADIFPNPTDNSLSIITKEKNETLEIEIRDISNRLVASYKVSSTGNVATVEFNLINGLYFISINNTKNETVTKKVVISK